jgi:hypothetical protein
LVFRKGAGRGQKHGCRRRDGGPEDELFCLLGMELAETVSKHRIPPFGQNLFGRSKID